MHTTEQVIRNAMQRPSDDSIVLNTSVGATLLIHLALMAVAIEMDFDELEKKAKADAHQTVRVITMVNPEAIEEPEVRVTRPREPDAFVLPPEVDRLARLDDLPPPLGAESVAALDALERMDIRSELTNPEPEDLIVRELVPSPVAPALKRRVDRGAPKGETTRKGRKHGTRVAARSVRNAGILAHIESSRGGTVLQAIAPGPGMGIGQLIGASGAGPFGGLQGHGFDGGPGKAAERTWRRTVRKALKSATQTLAKSHDIRGRITLRVEPSGRVRIVNLKLEKGDRATAKRVLRALKVTPPPQDMRKFQRSFTLRLVG